MGDTLYLSGHLGRDPVTSQLVSGGIEAETRQALANLGEVLKTAGMGFEHVTTVTAYITNFDEFERFNTVYREYFPRGSSGESHGAGRGAQCRRARRAADDCGEAVD